MVLAAGNRRAPERKAVTRHHVWFCKDSRKVSAT